MPLREKGPVREAGRDHPRVDSKPDRALTREEIQRSPELRQAYAKEYAEALKLTPDRGLAKDIARVNVTARVAGDAPVITRDAVEQLGPKGLTRAITKAGPTLGLEQLRAAMPVVRAVARLIERAASPEMEQ